ncbi:hypothetical protein FRC11_010231, partial [Ceratobasidium sp. 423]
MLTITGEDQLDGLIERFEKTRIRYGQELARCSASTAAKPEMFAKQQRGQYYMLNGRPRQHTGAPIILYHPVFGNFLSNLQSSEPLPSKFYYRVLEYFWTSQDIHGAETGSSRGSNCDASTWGGLEEFLGKLWKVLEPGVPDATAIGPNGTYSLIIEIKNEVGTGGCDPSIQAAQSYSRLWRQAKLWGWCCCPSILIAIAGPWMCVLGAVFLDCPIVQPLTDFLWLGSNPNKPRDFAFLARVFECVIKAREELDSYYANFIPPKTEEAVFGAFFPYPTYFIGEDGERVEFSYTTHLVRTRPELTSHLNRSKSQFAPDKVVFLAKLRDSSRPTPIVVKFVQSYNVDAHKLLAQAGLAPKLLYDGSMRENERLGPDYRMIVMEYIDGIDLGRYAGPALPERVSEDITRALSILHAEDLVFGDLRPPNVMLVRDDAGTIVGAKLIDFDWCGKHQEERYPFDMNNLITWASGVGPGALLDKQHDIDMMDRLP